MLSHAVGRTSLVRRFCLSTNGAALDGCGLTSSTDVIVLPVFLLSRLLECLLSLAGSTLPSKTSAVATVVPVARRPTPASGSKAPTEAVGADTNSTTAEGTETATAIAPSVVTAGAADTVVDTEDTPEEVVLLFRSRAAELLHYFVLLLHVVLNQLWRACSDEEAQRENAAAVEGVNADRAERRLAVQQSVLEASLVLIFVL
jgi:hypothetical protein